LFFQIFKKNYILKEFIIHTNPLNQIDFSRNKLVVTINAHSYCVSKSNSLFRSALINSNIVLPDGIGIVWGYNFLNKQKIKKIAGYDLFNFLIDKLNDQSGSVFFLGSSLDNLECIKQKCKIDFPKLKVEYYSPPFKKEFTKSDNEKMIAAVNDFKPDVLFLGMTAPKQEIWAYENKDYLKVKNICCVGAVFDFYSGKTKRPSGFWINLGLEWFPRFLNEPKRLFYRNFISTPKFILEILSIKIFKKGIL